MWFGNKVYNSANANINILGDIMGSAFLTQSGFNKFISQCFGTANVGQVQYFAIGTGSTAAGVTDTGLESTTTSWTEGGTSFKAYLSTTQDSSGQRMNLRGFISAAEATGKGIYEYCDLTNDTTKVPAARFVWTLPVTKTTSNQLTVLTVYKRA